MRGSGFWSCDTGYSRRGVRSWEGRGGGINHNIEFDIFLMKEIVPGLEFKSQVPTFQLNIVQSAAFYKYLKAKQTLIKFFKTIFDVIQHKI